MKQYKTLEDAQKDENSESSFEVVLDMGNSTEKLTGADVVTFNSNNYIYKDSEQVKVLANRYYRIEEDTDWSWKYTLKGVKQVDSNNISSTDGNVVILKTYLDALNNISDGKVVPIAEFYNALDTTKEDIEGDTDSIPNKIKKE